MTTEFAQPYPFLGYTKNLCRMWQNSPDASRSPWVQTLKDIMKKPDRDATIEADLDAETEVLGGTEECEFSQSSLGIPDNMLDVVDEPDFQESGEDEDLWLYIQCVTWVSYSNNFDRIESEWFLYIYIYIYILTVW